MKKRNKNIILENIAGQVVYENRAEHNAPPKIDAVKAQPLGHCRSLMGAQAAHWRQKRPTKRWVPANVPSGNAKIVRKGVGMSQTAERSGSGETGYVAAKHHSKTIGVVAGVCPK